MKNLEHLKRDAQKELKFSDFEDVDPEVFLKLYLALHRMQRGKDPSTVWIVGRLESGELTRDGVYFSFEDAHYALVSIIENVTLYYIRWFPNRGEIIEEANSDDYESAIRAVNNTFLNVAGGQFAVIFQESSIEDLFEA